MKEGIHPEYKPAKVVCACGNVVETRSTRGDFHVEICSQCHPFFTGKQKILDTAGRIERFRTRYAGSPAKPETKKAAPAPAPSPAPKKAEAKENRAAKRAKSGKSKPKTEAAAPAEAAAAEAAPAEAPAPEAKPE